MAGARRWGHRRRRRGGRRARNRAEIRRGRGAPGCRQRPVAQVAGGAPRGARRFAPEAARRGRQRAGRARRAAEGRCHDHGGGDRARPAPPARSAAPRRPRGAHEADARDHRAGNRSRRLRRIPRRCARGPRRHVGRSGADRRVRRARVTGGGDGVVVLLCGGRGQHGKARDDGDARRADQARGRPDRGGARRRRSRGADAEGTGLVGVRDRVAALGGSMRIDSPPGSGTSMLIDLPSLLCGQPQSALRGSADPPADPRSYVRDSRSSGGSS